MSSVAPIVSEAQEAIEREIGQSLARSRLTKLNQFEAREPWDLVRGAGERSKPHSGHYVYVSGYTKRGPVCVTCGRKQPMSWAFVNNYCDDAYAIIDAINTPEKKRNLDSKKIKKFLEGRAPVERQADQASTTRIKDKTQDSLLRR